MITRILFFFVYPGTGFNKSKTRKIIIFSIFMELLLYVIIGFSIFNYEPHNDDYSSSISNYVNDDSLSEDEKNSKLVVGKWAIINAKGDVKLILDENKSFAFTDNGSYSDGLYSISNGNLELQWNGKSNSTAYKIEFANDEYNDLYLTKINGDTYTLSRCSIN